MRLTARFQFQFTKLLQRLAPRHCAGFVLLFANERDKGENFSLWQSTGNNIFPLLAIIPVSLALLGWRLGLRRRQLQPIRDQRRPAETAHEKLQTNAQAGNWEYTLDSSWLNWSDDYYRVHGHEPQSVVSGFEIFLHSIHPEDRDEVLKKFLLASMKRMQFHAQFRLLRPDGSVRYVVSEGQPVLDDEEKVIRMEGVQIDITEGFLHNTELQKSERLQRSGTNNLPAALFYIDDQYRLQFCNRDFEILLGRARHEILGKDADEVFGTAISSILEKPARLALAGESQSFESVHVFNKVPHYHIQNMIPDRRDGKVQGFFGLMVDISDLQHVNQRLHAPESSLKKAQNLVHIGTWECGIDGSNMTWSDESYHLLDLVPQSVTADAALFFNTVMPVERSALIKQMARAIEQRISYHLVCRIVREDGIERDLELWWDVVADETGALTRIRGAVKDITMRRQTDMAMHRSSQLELEIGYEIQLSLLIGDVPTELNGAWITTHTEPSQGMHGDFVAVSQHSSTQFNVLVGDVMGKGIHAAMIGAGVKSTYYQVLAEMMAAAVNHGIMPGPAALINSLHARMSSKLMSMNCFVTLALYTFDVEAGTLTFVNAGHTPALLSRLGSAQVELLQADNLPLGVMANEMYSEHVVALCDEDLLVVYTDGISEARSSRVESKGLSNGLSRGDEFGLQSIAGWLGRCNYADVPSAAALQMLRLELAQSLDEDQIKDDQTVMMVRLKPRPIPLLQTISGRRNRDYLSIPMSFDSLPVLRERLLKITRLWPAAASGDFVLALFEAATNAIRHNPMLLDDASLCWRLSARADSLSAELFYLGAPVNLDAVDLPDFSGISEGGFGVYIMRSILDEINYDAPLPGLVRVKMVKYAM